MERRKCLNCNQLFDRKSNNKNNWHLKKFCSEECRDKYNYITYRKVRRQQQGFRRRGYTCKCRWCENRFSPLTSKNLFCSGHCRTKFHHYRTSLVAFKKNSIRRCLFCKNLFTFVRSDQKMCSEKCGEKYFDAIRSSKRGGRSKEIARRYSLTVDDYKNFIGICSICTFDRSINIHHVRPRNSGGKNRKENYMPLCFNCHKLIHTGYTLREIIDYYQKKGIPVNRNVGNTIKLVASIPSKTA